MLLPRPTLLTHLVVGVSLAGGIAVGAAAGLVLLAAHAVAARRAG